MLHIATARIPWPNGVATVSKSNSPFSTADEIDDHFDHCV